MDNIAQRVLDDRELKHVILMHGDIEVCKWSTYNLTDVVRIDEIYNIEHMPIGVGDSTLMFEQWLKWRSIPYSRKNMKLILQNLNLETTDFMIESCNGASLSDTYWYKKEDSNLTWDKINFFDNEWYNEDSKLLFLKMKFGTSNKYLNTPDCVSIGNQPKAWIREEGINYLLKADKYPYAMEAFSEEVYYEVSKMLIIPCIKYDKYIDKENDIVASKCKCICTYGTDIVTANWYMRQYNYIKDEQYIMDMVNSFGKYTSGRSLATRFMTMLTLDYLLLNSDRHLDNFGFLMWNDSKVPSRLVVYDNGDSLARNTHPEKSMCYLLKNDTSDVDYVTVIINQLYHYIHGKYKCLSDLTGIYIAFTDNVYDKINTTLDIKEKEYTELCLDISEYSNRKERIKTEIKRRCEVLKLNLKY